MSIKNKIFRVYLYIFGKLLSFLIKFQSISASEQKKTILLFADGTYESNALMLVPVANELTGRGVNTHFYCEYGEQKMQDLSNRVFSEVNLQTIKKYKMIQNFSLYKTQGIKNILARFAYSFVVFKMLYDSRPIYILVANDIMLPSKILIIVSKAMNIKNLSLQHGMICPPYFPIEADILGVYSSGVMDFIVQNNFAPASKIIALGNPKWDELVWKVQEKASHKIQAAKTILVFSQASDLNTTRLYMHNNIVAMFSLVEKLLLKLPNIKVIVRPHPIETQGIWQKYISKSYDNLYIENDSPPLLESMTKCDLCLSIDSTAFFEAALFGLECFAYRPYKNPDILSEYETEMDGFVKVFRDESNIIDEIRVFFSNDRLVEQTSSEKILTNAGIATKKVVDFVLDNIL